MVDTILFNHLNSIPCSPDLLHPSSPHLPTLPTQAHVEPEAVFSHSWGEGGGGGRGRGGRGGGGGGGGPETVLAPHLHLQASILSLPVAVAGVLLLSGIKEIKEEKKSRFTCW